MLDTVTIEEIDRLLDELEQLAQTSPSRQQFFDAALQRLKFLSGCHSAAIVMRAASQQWLMVAATGNTPSESVQQLLSDDNLQSDHGLSPDRRLLAVPLRKGLSNQPHWQRGALVVEYQQPVSTTDCQELVKLCEAFAEVIALRQGAELETLLDRQWPSFQQSLVDLSRATGLAQGAYLIVNDLASLLRADRVTLAHAAHGGADALAISGVVRPEKRADSVVAIERLCQQAIQHGEPLLRHAGQTDTTRDWPSNLLSNFACIPVATRSDRPREYNAAVLFEWQEYEAFLAGSTTLNYVFPVFVLSWQQHVRWSRVPVAVRRFVALRSVSPSGRRSGTLTRFAFAFVILAILTWGLTRPSTLRIEAQGTLQPVQQRAVFAALDGVVEQVMTRDGQAVKRGDTLVQLRSPMLEIQIQEVAGELQANSEKRDGLNVAINQLTNDGSTDYTRQSRLSSEIRELETQLKTLQEKQAALLAEREKLKIVAPITGRVVARQIEKILESRPVKRGDTLLRVVSLDGPWQLELQVSDQDSGYVKRKLFGPSRTMSGLVSEQSDASLQFVIAAHPDRKLDAQVTWIAESARNPNGEGMMVDMLAAVDRDIATQGHMGATVYAYFDCGQQPFWFVWSRPLVEAIQRRLWF